MADTLLKADKLGVFVSYSREDLAFADQLVVTLELAGFAPTIDRVGIHGAEAWQDKLGQLIREADTVVFVLSPASAKSKMCAWEVEQAQVMGKRIIPVMARPLEDTPVPPDLAALNYIFLFADAARPGSGWGTGMRELDRALRTDLAWLREHTRLLQRAVEWEAGGRVPGRLLSGADIREARDWVARRPRDAPELTAQHMAFIAASETWEAEQTGERERALAERERLVREAEADRVSREKAQAEALRSAQKLAGRTAVGLVLASLLAVVTTSAGYYAFVQKREAEEQASRADDQRRLAVEQQRRAEAEVAKGRDTADVASLLLGQTVARDDKYMTREELDRVLFNKLLLRATKGSISAQRYVGYMYTRGQGVIKDYAKALEWFEKAATSGDAEAVNSIGRLYARGEGVPQDYAKALEWYEKAAKAGNTLAMTNIGEHFRKGQGVAKDYVKAREWHVRAADAGDDTAMFNLGWYYANGQGVPKDYAKALEWYEMSAEAGNAHAMQNIGILYESGWGVAVDAVKAREWFERAAAAGHPGAMINIGAHYAYGRGITKDYAKAREWYEKAAAAGVGLAMANIGTLYAQGQGVVQNYVQARDWFERAAEAGSEVGQFNLGVLYANGLGAAQDYSKAREWYEKAAAAGSEEAAINIGALYANGHGVQQDYAKAREWFEKAAETGHDVAMINIGGFYASGRGVAQDYIKAREWYEKAAMAGNVRAMTRIGALFANGQGMSQDYAKALTWYQKAVAAGDTSASTLLSSAWYALLARVPAQALATSQRLLAAQPGELAAEINRAHALMYLGRAEEARAVFLAHSDKRIPQNDNKLWQEVIGEDFTQLRRAGLEHPQMAEIEAGLISNKR